MGAGAIGALLKEPDGTAIPGAELSERIGPVESPTTAEYRALLRGLELARERLGYAKPGETVIRFEGTITNTLGASQPRRRSASAGQELRFSTGGGGAQVTVRNFKGAIVLGPK